MFEFFHKVWCEFNFLTCWTGNCEHLLCVGNSGICPSFSDSQELELLAAETNEESAKLVPATQLKPLHKIISEHKDVVKIVIQLNSIIATFKGDVTESLDAYTKYSELWTKVSIVINAPAWCADCFYMLFSLK